MNDVHRDSFDEALLSGYLDGELTQADAQRVRLYLEDNPEARRELDALQEMRDAARTTRFAIPDEGWDESPRTPVSSVARKTGWLLVLAWSIGMTLLALWAFITSPESLWAKLLAAGPFLGFGFLFVSVLLDRIRSAKSDRYRRVEK